MGKKKRKSNKQKVRTVVKKVIPEEYKEDNIIKKEIKELEEKRDAVPKGFKGFVQKLSINKGINDRRKFLNAGRQSKFLERQGKLAKQRVNIEKARAELKGLKEKSSVNFDDLGGSIGMSGPINSKSIFS